MRSAGGLGLARLAIGRRRQAKIARCRLIARYACSRSAWRDLLWRPRSIARESRRSRQVKSSDLDRTLAMRRFGRRGENSDGGADQIRSEHGPQRAAGHAGAAGTPRDRGPTRLAPGTRTARIGDEPFRIEAPLHALEDRLPLRCEGIRISALNRDDPGPVPRVSDDKVWRTVGVKRQDRFARARGPGRHRRSARRRARRAHCMRRLAAPPCRRVDSLARSPEPEQPPEPARRRGSAKPRSAEADSTPS